MLLSRADIKQFIIKHLKEGLSGEEMRQLEIFMQQSAENREQVTRLLNKESIQEGLEQLYGSKAAVWEKLHADVKPARRRLNVVWMRRVAAGLLLMLATVFTWLLVQRYGLDQTPTGVLANIPAPSQTKAYVTLPNGQKVLLDSLTAAGGLSPRMTNDGIVYQQAVGAASARNTLTVPRGSKPVRLILADGTEVWVNVASSLTYTTSFSGPERMVEMTGEAYFNVAHNSRQPFIVKGKNAIIKVYGTVFNVNAYEDEQETIATLFSGSISITQPGSGASGMMKPGQQATVGEMGDLHVTDLTNMDEPISWVKGRFFFENSKLQAILRQLSRWYDVEIVYEGEVAGKTFSADLSRDKSLVSMLRILEAGGVKTRLEGRKVTVKP
ncbi:MAG TPA: FecR domain-containing protein [Chitinophaga sp.]|uniref:FecR domain-containing protein n=1 Tax=Chitinophaga sp. TaxID=1869181 RepID=UPI002D189D7F|nr:FecR domain-containing protein [Chitinophaga sp.]HVI45641.1 FecR domain-containing protein [Chitinophaga sp.]